MLSLAQMKLPPGQYSVPTRGTGQNGKCGAVSDFYKQQIPKQTAVESLVRHSAQPIGWQEKAKGRRAAELASPGPDHWTPESFTEQDQPQIRLPEQESPLLS